MLLAVLCIGLIPYIFFLITLQNTLKAIAPGNRKMEPGMVWLSLIPLFNLVWQFIVVNRMTESIEAQLGKSGELMPERPAQSVGMAMCVLFCFGWIPFLGGLLSLAGIICWIIYWVKISEFKRRIESQPDTQDPDSLIFGSKF